MIVKIRFRSGPSVRKGGRKNRRLAFAAAALLTPAALTACALAVWKLAADLRMAGPFGITDGLFSHWQVWLAVGIFIQTMAIFLNRYGRGERIGSASEEEPVKSILHPGF
jgi:hypothetical protein